MVEEGFALLFCWGHEVLVVIHGFVFGDLYGLGFGFAVLVLFSTFLVTAFFTVNC